MWILFSFPKLQVWEQESPAAGDEGTGSQVALLQGRHCSNSAHPSPAKQPGPASCLQVAARSPSQAPPPQPRAAWSSLQRKFSQVRPVLFPQPQHDPPQLFHSPLGQESPKAPCPGPVGLCYLQCCSFHRGQPNSRMTHINKSGRGGRWGHS